MTTRFVDRPGWWNVKKANEDGYGDLAYDIGLEPLVETITHDGEEVGFITRNRYDALARSRLMGVSFREV
jgi:hypothetical protein